MIGNEASALCNFVYVLTRIPQVAWKHILLNGHYTFQSSKRLLIWMHWMPA